MAFRKATLSSLGLALVLMAHVTLSVSIEVPGSCEIPIATKQHFHIKWPLVFTPAGELYPTKGAHEERKVVVEHGAEVLLSCGPNYLRNFQKKEVLSVRCNGASGNFSVIDGGGGAASESAAEMSITKFTCDLRVIEEVLAPVDGCTDPKWTATNFGYVDPKDKMAVIVGEACYDTTAGKTIFAHVKLGDKNSSYLRKVEKTFLTTSARPSPIGLDFDFYNGKNFLEFYEGIVLRINLKTPPLKILKFIDEPLLSNAQLQAVKLLGWNCLISNDADPLLQSVKADVRELSERVNLDVFVGSHGMELSSTSGSSVTGHNKQALIWIVVKQGKRALALGIHNELIFGTSQTLVDMESLCSSDCGRVTWLKRTPKEGINRLRLVCCSYEDFQKSVREVPALENIKELLT